jgi:DNA-binding GntR family transcriptional regulator
MTTARPRKSTQSRQTYARLKELIQRGELSADEPLTEAKVCRLLSVGRGPARESLLRLEAEGLVRSRGPHKTRYVAYIEDETPEQLRHKFELRESLDGLAARSAALHMTGAQILTLRSLAEAAVAAIARGDRHARAEAMRSFTDTLRRDCGNPLVATALEASGVVPLYARDDATDAGLEASKRYPDPRLPELMAAVEAIASHDPDAAESRMREWVRGLSRVLVAWLAAHPRGGDAR